MILQSDSGIWQVAWSGGSSIKPRMNGSQNIAWIPIKRTYQVCLLALNFISTRSNLATINRRPLRFVPNVIYRNISFRKYFGFVATSRVRAPIILRGSWRFRFSIIWDFPIVSGCWYYFTTWYVGWRCLVVQTIVIQESKQGALIPPLPTLVRKFPHKLNSGNGHQNTPGDIRIPCIKFRTFYMSSCLAKIHWVST